MNLRQIISVLLIVLFSGIIASCTGDDTANSEAVARAVAATQTLLAWEDEQELTRLTEDAAASIPADTPEPEIVHIDFPNYVEGSNTFVSDFSTLPYAPEKTTPGDYYQLNRMERPFSAEDMDYFGDLDIIRVELKFDSSWFYATFMLTGELRDASEVFYGLEFDLDSDGRGDFLIWALLPSGPDWTTDGVQVF